MIPAIALYCMATHENPWHKGKRAMGWSQQLRDWRSDAEAAEAAEALDEIGDRGLAALSIAIESNDPRVSKKAADVVANICSRTKVLTHRYRVIFKYLLAALSGATDPSVRIHLARALPRCGPVSHNEAVEKVLTAVSQVDPDVAVREAATRVLDEIRALPRPSG
jgi:hypothetical protein